VDVPILLTTNFVFIIAFIATYLVHIDDIHEPIFGSLLYGNNIIYDGIIPTFETISFYFYPMGEVAFIDEWIHKRDPMSQSFMLFM